MFYIRPHIAGDTNPAHISLFLIALKDLSLLIYEQGQKNEIVLRGHANFRLEVRLIAVDNITNEPLVVFEINIARSNHPEYTKELTWIKKGGEVVYEADNKKLEPDNIIKYLLGRILREL